eukprot:jgi/Botrbrau1/6168/Bobra.0344s0009.1
MGWTNVLLISMSPQLAPQSAEARVYFASSGYPAGTLLLRLPSLQDECNVAVAISLIPLKIPSCIFISRQRISLQSAQIIDRRGRTAQRLCTTLTRRSADLESLGWTKEDGPDGGGGPKSTSNITD